MPPCRRHDREIRHGHAPPPCRCVVSPDDRCAYAGAGDSNDAVDNRSTDDLLRAILAELRAGGMGGMTNNITVAGGNNAGREIVNELTVLNALRGTS